MADYTITAGDTAPGIEYELTDDGTGNAPNAANIASAEFQLFTTKMQQLENVAAKALVADEVQVASAATVTTAGSGNPLLRYAWQNGDTEPAGSYFARFEVTYSNGKTASYPNGNPLTIEFTTWPS